MKQNKVTIQVHAYTLTLKDLRTGETVNDSVILTKEQLKAAHETGLGLEGILTAVYNRKGYHVTGISAPVKRTIGVELHLTPAHDEILVTQLHHTFPDGATIRYCVGNRYDAETEKGASV